MLAGMVELVDAPDSKSGSARSVGSTPTTRTIDRRSRFRRSAGGRSGIPDPAGPRKPELARPSTHRIVRPVQSFRGRPAVDPRPAAADRVILELGPGRCREPAGGPGGHQPELARAVLNARLRSAERRRQPRQRFRAPCQPQPIVVGVRPGRCASTIHRRRLSTVPDISLTAHDALRGKGGWSPDRW